MMSKSTFAPLVIPLLLAVPGQSFAEAEGAQVIFTTSHLVVINAAGVKRHVMQGGFIHAGERAITPPGVSAQIRLPDGTLLGARPGSDIRLDSIVNSLGKNVLVLNEGNVRVINVATARGPVPMPVDVINANSTLELKSGDGEARNVKTGSQISEPGNYNRLQTGVATVRNETGTVTLAPMRTETSVAVAGASSNTLDRETPRLSTLAVSSESLTPVKVLDSTEPLSSVTIKTPIQTVGNMTTSSPAPLTPATLTVVSPAIAPAVISSTSVPMPTLTTSTTLSTTKLLSPTIINTLPTLK